MNSSWEIYQTLMLALRHRFEIIESLRTSQLEPYFRAETAALPGRKIIEGIAFGCLVAIENGLKTVPRDAKGQWNAEKIFKNLKSKKILTLPSPSHIRAPTGEEIKEYNIKSVIEGIPEKRLTFDELLKIYQSLHVWLHEVNPYVYKEHTKLDSKKLEMLWNDLTRLRSFMEKHFISIEGAAFFCVLWDNQDNLTKVAQATKIPD